LDRRDHLEQEERREPQERMAVLERKATGWVPAKLYRRKYCTQRWGL
jgi:hypothetical protein